MSAYGMGPFGSGPFGDTPENDERPNQLTDPPDDFDGLEADDIADLLVAWFLDNFEDPAERMPRDPESEYGYVFMDGGPYDAREVLNDFFYDEVGEEAIEKAVIKLERSSSVWSPKPDVRPYTEYVVTNENDIVTDNGIPVVVSGQPYNRLEALADKALRASFTATKIEKLFQTGIGHNNPPEPIEKYTFDANDLRTIQNQLSNIVTLVQTQQLKTDELINSVELLKQKQSLLKGFLSGMPKGIGATVAATITATVLQTENGQALLKLFAKEIDAVIDAALSILG